MSTRFVLALILATASLASCHHDAAPPAAPADVPPLPPASGTPIGYLLDDATDLKLQDDQRTKLTAIDRELAASLDEIDTQLRAANKPAASDQPAQPMGRHGGGRHGGGGMGGGGMGGGGSPGGGGHHRGSSGSGSGSGASGGNSADVGRLTEARATDVRDAIQRALALLDDAQRAAATKLLDDHGVDVDAGRPVAQKARAQPPAAGDADAPVPDEP